MFFLFQKQNFSQSLGCLGARGPIPMFLLVGPGTVCNFLDVQHTHTHINFPVWRHTHSLGVADELL